MIPANQARELFQGSGVEADRFIANRIAQQVIDVAKAGKDRIFIMIDSIESYCSVPTCAGVNQQIMAKLQNLGYKVSFEKDNSFKYVPAAYQDNDGKGPEHVNYGFMISW